VASTAQPAPSFLVVDKMTAYAIDQEAQPVVVVSKPDLASPQDMQAAYAHSGIPLVVANALTGEGVGQIKERLKGKFSVFCGNSGVGKSTLMNAIAPGLGREVGTISQKLGRGRHTTREVEVFEVEDGLLADTPGFASFDLQRAGAILSDNLQLCFPEIKSRIGQCKFSSCTHTNEVGCAVRAAVKSGGMAPSRYQSYVTLFEEARAAENQY
jgi:ribosome biogenesis GTPase